MKVEIERIAVDEEETAVLKVHDQSEEIRNFVRYIEEERFRSMILPCVKDGVIHQIHYWDIYYIEAIQEVQYVHTKENIFCTRKRLYELAVILPPEFVRASKSALLNMSQVSLYRPISGGIMLAEFENGNCTYISRKYLKGLRMKIREGLL